MLNQRAEVWVVLVSVAMMMVCSGGSAQGISTVTIVDIGTLSGLGGVQAQAYGLNSLGDVVGSYVNASGVEHAFVWHDTNGNQKVDAGERHDLGTLGGANSVAYSINDSGQVTGGSYKTGASVDTAFVWNDANDNWVADAGEMASLGTLGGTVSRGYRINDAGEVVGLTSVASGAIRAFRWVDSNGDWKYNAGETMNMGTLGGEQSRAFGINSDGNVAGYAYDSSSLQQTIRWIDANSNKTVDDGEMVAIAAPGTPAWGFDINDSGAMAGFFTTGGKRHAFYYDSDGMVDIHSLLSGAQASKAYSISEEGLVCGTYYPAGGGVRGFIYDSLTGVVTDLNDLLLPDSGWVIQSVRDIEGEMAVGYGTLDGERHAFIAYWTTEEEEEIPEPGTLMLVGTGVLGLAGVLRRRLLN